MKERHHLEHSQAALFAELAVLATSWDGIPNAIKIADQKNFAGSNFVYEKCMELFLSCLFIIL
jgi:hypothetical protein